MVSVNRYKLLTIIAKGSILGIMALEESHLN